MSSYLVDGYYRESAASAPVDERVAFIRRTYAHLFMAVIAFAGLTAVLIKAGIGLQMIDVMRTNHLSWLLLMVLFIGGTMFASYLARSDSQPATQYLGLCIYVGLYTLIFLPILTICTLVPRFADIPLQAGILTMTVFGGLTAVVFISKKDFSFLGYGLSVLGFLALGLIIIAMIGNFSLGIWFAFAMVALASGYILYDTSNILHHYDTRSHVAASLALFASLGMLFSYIVRIMMYLASER